MEHCHLQKWFRSFWLVPATIREIHLDVCLSLFDFDIAFQTKSFALYNYVDVGRLAIQISKASSTPMSIAEAEKRNQHSRISQRIHSSTIYIILIYFLFALE